MAGAGGTSTEGMHTLSILSDAYKVRGRLETGGSFPGGAVSQVTSCCGELSCALAETLLA